MRDKTFYLFFFVSLCRAQRATMVHLQERQLESLYSSDSSSTKAYINVNPLVSVATPSPQSSLPSVVGTGSPSNVAQSGGPTSVQPLDPSAVPTVVAAPPAGTVSDAVVEPSAASPLSPQQEPSPGTDQLSSGVFTSVLYPSVPTAGPTGVLVPTVVTYTGTFAASLVPSGYSIGTPIPVTTAPGSDLLPTTPGSALNSPPTDLPSLSSPIPNSLPIENSTPIISNPVIPSTASQPLASSTVRLPISSSATNLSSPKKPTTSQPATTIGLPTNNAAAIKPTDPPHPTTALSNQQTVGLIAGAICAGVLLIVCISVCFILRKRSKGSPDDPGIYPQEAYLYDPPTTPPRDAGTNRGGDGKATDKLRPPSPEMGFTERAGLLGGSALGTDAAGSISSTGKKRPHRLFATPGGPIPIGPLSSSSTTSRRRDGYSPIESTDIADFRSNNYTFTNSTEPYRNSLNRHSQRFSGSKMPLNVNAHSTRDSGSGTFVPSDGTSAGPSIGRSTSTHVGGVGAGAPTFSPQMQKMREAWGL